MKKRKRKRKRRKGDRQGEGEKGSEVISEAGGSPPVKPWCDFGGVKGRGALLEENGGGEDAGAKGKASDGELELGGQHRDDGEEGRSLGLIQPQVLDEGGGGGSQVLKIEAVAAKKFSGGAEVPVLRELAVDLALLEADGVVVGAEGPQEVIGGETLHQRNSPGPLNRIPCSRFQEEVMGGGRGKK